MENSSNQSSAQQASAPKSNSLGIMAVTGVAILAVAIIGYKTMSKDQPAQASALPVNSQAAPDMTDGLKIKPADTKYKDGVYDVVGEYVSPAGPETIEVKITLKDNVITSADVTAKATAEKSKFMQGLFVSNYKSLVVGKSIQDLKLDKVAGSSLTPKGFNDALEKIKAGAQS